MPDSIVQHDDAVALESDEAKSEHSASFGVDVIRTPDQRLRVFVSSTLQEMAPERAAARTAITHLHLTPILFELGARPHPPRDLYRAYLAQSDIFIGLYWQRYGWVAPDMTISGLEDEYSLSGNRPKLIYVKTSADAREPRMMELLDRIRNDGVSYKPFETADELQELIENDLALLLTERFAAAQVSQAADREHEPEQIGGTLPVERTALVDRDEQVTAALQLLRRDDVGLVTLTGPGGTGKTRLALHIAGLLRQAFEDGVYFIQLESIRDPELVATTIAQSFGIHEDGGRSVIDSVKDYLRSRKLLMVLDNLEQITGAARLIADLLAVSPGLKIMTTSRTSLHVHGEKELEVPPLPVPASTPLMAMQDAARSPAVELFVARAQDVKPSFTLTDEIAPVVAEICRRLDGLPLAIELAAARIKVLSAQALLTRLEHRLPLLTGGAQDLPQRQQTLRSAISWSYDLLTPREQHIFRQLAVFAGTFALEAVLAVCTSSEAGTASVEGDALLDDIESLVDKNLLKSLDGPGGEPRFSMLQTIREYAQEQLAASGELNDLQQRHGAYYVQLVETAEPHLRSSGRGPWLDRLESDRENFRAVLAWSTGPTGDVQSGARLAGALAWFWHLRGYLTEGCSWLDGVLARRDPAERTAVWARVLYSAGLVAWSQGDYAPARTRATDALSIFRESGDRQWIGYAGTIAGLATLSSGDLVAARALLQESLNVLREIADAWGAATALCCLSGAEYLAGDTVVARAHCEESLAAFQAASDTWGISLALTTLGRMSASQGDAASARLLFEQSLPLLRAANDRWNLALALVNVGSAAIRQGDDQQADAFLREGITLWQMLGNTPGIVMALAGFGTLAAARRQAERAGRLYSAAQALLPSGGTLVSGAGRAAFERAVSETKSSLDESAFSRGWAAGQVMSLDQAIAYALNQ